MPRPGAPVFLCLFAPALITPAALITPTALITPATLITPAALFYHSPARPLDLLLLPFYNRSKH